MQGNFLRKLIAIPFVLLFLFSFMGESAFAAKAASYQPTHSTVVNRPTNLPCNKTFEESGNGYNSVDVPGGYANVYDHFHQIGCVTGADHYLLDGYAGANVYDNSAEGDTLSGASMTLTTAISLDGVNVSFNFPPSAGFTLQNGSTATHTQTGSNGLSYRYSNLDASIWSCFEIHQTDTVEVTTGNAHNQTAAEIGLSCG